jgi:hypothetical protein
MFDQFGIDFLKKNLNLFSYLIKFYLPTLQLSNKSLSQSFYLILFQHFN